MLLQSKTQKKKTGIVIKLMAVLFCLALFSTHYCSLIYAKFLQQAPGNALASIASFKVEAQAKESDTPGSVEIKAYENEGRMDYIIVLKNKGESAAEYEVEIMVDGERLVNDAGEPILLTGEIAAGQEKEVAVPLFIQDENGYDYNAQDGNVVIPFAASVTFTQIN